MKYEISNENKREIVRRLSCEPRIAYWRLAQAMGVHENTLAKMMREPDDQQTAAIMRAIDAIRSSQQV